MAGVVLKTSLKALVLVLIVTAASMLFPRQVNAQHVGISFQLFYDQLSPYGQWVDYPEYGYVWLPDAEPDFSPYATRGHWVYTHYGWTWVSDYRWGWAPFHYGRWDYDDYYGWMWVPDNEWGPSWVTWRHADGYYGWAPMRPGITISLSFGGRDRHDHDHWRFVRDRDISRSDVNRYYVGGRDRERIINNSTIINQTYIDRSRNVTYVAGPPREDVQRATKQNIRTHAVQDMSSPGQNLSNDQLQIYRPQVQRTGNKARKPAPARVAKREEVKRPSERSPSGTSTRTRQPEATRQQDAVKQQNNRQRQDAARQQDAVKQQNARQQQDAARQQDAAKQQNAKQQENAARQQDAVKQQNNRQRQDAARQQDAVKQQNARQQQDAARQQNAVKQQNARQQQDAARQQDAVKQQNARQQQDAARQQNAVKQQNARQQQDAAKQQNARQQQSAKPGTVAPTKTRTPQAGTTTTERGKKRTK